MDTRRTVRALGIGAAGLLCTTVTLPASASLPGDGYLAYAWSSDSVQQQVFDLVPDNEATCFLAGLGGELSLANTSYMSVAIVSDVEGPPGEPGGWELTFYQGTSSGSAGAAAACVWSTTNRISGLQVMGTGTQNLGPGTTDRHCFLQGFVSTDDSLGNTGVKADVYLDPNDNNWYLQTWNMSENVNTYAVCVDIPGANTHNVNNVTGSYTVTAFEDTATTPEVCGLRGFEGPFKSPNASDGVWLNWPSQPGYWSLNATNNTRGWLACLQ